MAPQGCREVAPQTLTVSGRGVPKLPRVLILQRGWIAAHNMASDEQTNCMRVSADAVCDEVFSNYKYTE